MLCTTGCVGVTGNGDLPGYRKQAERVTITRDNWGVPHIYGKTDADAVFGLMYAQCEESFERVERNFIQKFGRMAEVEGPAYLFEDLKMRLLYDTVQAKLAYKESPPWLVTLMKAFADGINYYLLTHPGTSPILLTHFEPWYALLMTDGAFISTVDGGLEPADTRELYGNNADEDTAGLLRHVPTAGEQQGSNGFALGPSMTSSRKAMLYINPHVTFDFRMEAHMVSEEGLNAYGAVTWGQFFVFQGFNEHCGWMHTSSMSDAADLYEEKTVKKLDSVYYEYAGKMIPVTTKEVEIKFLKDGMQTRKFVTYTTHHGPVVGSRNNKWLSLKRQSHSVTGLVQSWQRTKARDLAGFAQTMELRANQSTNTLYADDKGNIAYWHGNFIPRRAPGYDWTQPVPGNVVATEWDGTHEVNETVHFLNPRVGWLQNCNSSAFTAAGGGSLKRDSFPAYMAPEGENFRSLQAVNHLSSRSNFTLDSLISLGTSRYLGAFDSLLPPLLEDHLALSPGDPLASSLKEPITLLKTWDKRSSVTSVASTLAIMWGYTLLSNTGYRVVSNEKASFQVELFTQMVRATPSRKRLEMLQEVIAGLGRIYGTWQVPWGDLNRYQKISGEVHPRFDDSKESLPVGFASALFGSLPSFEASWNNTKKGYGVAGNSFVAVVEFGQKINAKSIIPGGQSFDRSSKHFTDQAQRYVEGKFKDVYFYREDVLKNKERAYHPGD
jgi:acyl-homoserine lactone acylase PvdQ